MEVSTGEARKRDLDHEATQLGTSDIGDDELEALLQRMSPAKRRCAVDRLTQLGVADGPA